MDLSDLTVRYKDLPKWLQVAIPFTAFALVCLIGGLIQGG